MADDRQPTLEDVARIAGVSTATVSRYFNSPGKLAASTSDRVQAAIQQLKYFPNLMAGGLRTNRSNLIALLMPELSFSMFTSTVESMVEKLSEAGYSVMLGLMGLDGDRLPSLIDAAIGRRADAIILTVPIEDRSIRERLSNYDVSVVETWGLPESPIDLVVGFSNFAIGEAIAAFAIQRGYRRPYILTTARAQRAMMRRDGFLSTWKAAGGETPQDLFFPHMTRFGDGRAAFRSLRALANPPDLVICSSDWLAQGLLVEAQVAGMSVPDELAIIGFGNLAMAAEMRPTITTIDIDGSQIGREVATLLGRRLRGEPIENPHVDVGFRLIARESA